MGRKKSNPRLPKTVDCIRAYCAYLFSQYELITCTCMFEPWEKVFINGLVLTIFTVVFYSSWVILPRYSTALYHGVVRLTEILADLTFQ